MADLYFPNPIAALPTPQFQEPQSNTGIIAMGSALQALSSVANNFRTKEMNVQKASQMADALEREGLTQEAGLYRAAAENYQTNFFATPEENERFNQSLLNDTLRLLTNKQEREMKAQQLQLERRYKEALIGNQEADARLAGRKLTLAEEEAAIRKGELNQAAGEKQTERKARVLQSTIDNDRQLLGQLQSMYDKALNQDYKSEEDYINVVGPIANQIKELSARIASNTQQYQSLAGMESAGGTSFLEPTIPQYQDRSEKTAEYVTEGQRQANAAFSKNPFLREFEYISPEGRKYTYTNPSYQPPTYQTERLGIDDVGNQTRSTSIRTPVPAGQRGGGRYGTPSGLPAGKLDTSALKGG